MKPNKKILIIDDDEEYNFITGEIFKDCGIDCELKFILFAAEALYYLDELETFPDLILLDINMPEMNGWDFLNYYQQRGYHMLHESTHIVVTSSSVYQEDKTKALSFGSVIEYLEKPISCEYIKKILS